MRLLFIATLFVFSQSSAQIKEESLEFNNLIFPINEFRSMRFFNDTASGINGVNAFFLAKFTEQMYPERLDYQFRYIQNGSKVVNQLPSTDELKIHPLINNSNFEKAFELRFRHYFEDTINCTFDFIHRFQFDTLKFLGIKSIKGYDPEVILINSPNRLLILYRGTDDIENNRFAEWKGTDFNFSKMKSDSVLNNAHIHEGFWKSFLLINKDLQAYLSTVDKNKPIWLSGHSLGGAMAILTGVYLKNLGYNVANIYTFASPRTIGDETFCSLANTLLPNRINRFEYYLDPVCLLWMPGYAEIGNRHWFDHSFVGNYSFYPNEKERYLLKKPFEFRRHKYGSDKKQEVARIYREKNYGFIPGLPTKLYYHNTQWSVKACYKLVPDNLKSSLPAVEDSYPYIYYGWSKGK